jgi:ATP-dependent DNA helicase RecG
LMHLLQDARLVENRGTGIRTMIEAMLAAKLEQPRFVDDRTSFLVTFSNASFMDPETMRWLRQFAERDLTADQRYALAYLRHHQTITNAEYQTLNRVNYTTAHRDLRGLERFSRRLLHFQ